MRKAIILYLLFLFSGIVFAQNNRNLYKLPHQQYSIIIHQDKYYFISNDSTYETQDAKNWKVYPNKIASQGATFNYFNTDSCTYVYYASAGNFYKFDGTNFSPLYQHGNHRNQYGGSPFIYKNQLHLFGGHGLFTDKNIITYFDMRSKEWEIENSYDDYYHMPMPRTGALTQIRKNTLYMGFGETKYTDVENKEDSQLNDIWTFDFISKHWTKIGEFPITHNPYYHRLEYKNGISLIFDESKCYGVDFEKNKFIEYTNRMSFSLSFPYIVYNPKTDRFLLVKSYKSMMDSVKIYTPEEFLGKKTIERQLYEPITQQPLNMTFAAVGIGLIGILGFLIYRYKNKTLPIYKQIKQNWEGILASLDAEEISIFKQIYENYPNKIPYLDLMQHFDQKISYDTQKKKLKTSLDEIDYKIQEFLDVDESIFVYSKNESDKRMKEVRLR